MTNDHGQPAQTFASMASTSARSSRIGLTATTATTQHMFLLIGAAPATGWLHGCVSLYAKGFLQTGASVSQEVRSANNRAQAVQTTSPAFSLSVTCAPVR